MTDVEGKVVYITGTGSGMGLASCKILAALGAHIVMFDRSEMGTTLASIETARRSPEQRVAHFQMDVADRSSVLSTMSQAITALGAPDIVIHMAGIGGLAEFADMQWEMFDRMMQVNVYGSRNVVEAVLPAMRARQNEQKGGARGKIVLVGSLGGMLPVYGYTAYGTSKFAVVGFAQCLRYELKPLGIDVACFCPGEVETPGLAAERQATHPAAVAMKKIGGTMPTTQAVSGLIDGIRRDQFMIMPGFKTKLVHWALRLTPLPLWNAITDVIVAGALRRRPS
ncbi:3-phenylpropionate-dihydrodiol/cinnamic acid-dihydrodiol dehydrogenase [compost metagenome]